MPVQETLRNLPKTLSAQVEQRIERRYPKLVKQRWEPLTDVQQWGLRWFCVGLLASIVYMLIFVAPQVLTNPLGVMRALPKTVMICLAIALDFGLKAYLICRRARHTGEATWRIATRVVLAHLLVWIPFVGLFIPYAVIYVKKKSGVKRGSELVSARKLQRYLVRRDTRLRRDRPQLPQHDPRFEIGGVSLPNYLENLGFFFVGSPGSGKSQSIKRMLKIMKDRPDFRAIILDRNGELLESFYEEGLDLIFNPSDARSVGWNHRGEQTGGETIAAALVPDDPKDRFFSEAAKSLLADLYDRCDNNAEVWEVVSTFTMEELGDFLTGGVSARYFQAENTGASVVSTLVNQMRFYRDLPDGEFSFSQWGREDDPRWLFLPIFENDSEKFKPLYSMAFDMMLRGLLSDERRGLKTAIVIDELGALNKLTSLPRLLAEARKFGGTAMLGTQTTAQIQRVYGSENSRIILQGTATKLILNCRDGKTAEEMAGLIGKQERVDVTSSHGAGLLSERRSEQIRETHTVMPSELQALEPLSGYLNISDGSPPAKVKIEPRSYVQQSERLIPAEASDLDSDGHQSLEAFRDAQGDLQVSQVKGRDLELTRR